MVQTLVQLCYSFIKKIITIWMYVRNLLVMFHLTEMTGDTVRSIEISYWILVFICICWYYEENHLTRTQWAEGNQDFFVVLYPTRGQFFKKLNGVKELWAMQLNFSMEIFEILNFFYGIIVNPRFWHAFH